MEYAISGGLTEGRAITIEGTVNPDADRFRVDLCFGPVIALHYNPRFYDGIVVRNSNEDDAWGNEEREGPMPFQRGQDFTITIVCETQSFKIMVDGTEAHTFDHRFKDFHNIDNLKIGGDLTVKSVQC